MNLLNLTTGIAEEELFGERVVDSNSAEGEKHLPKCEPIWVRVSARQEIVRPDTYVHIHTGLRTGLFLSADPTLATDVICHD